MVPRIFFYKILISIGVLVYIAYVSLLKISFMGISLLLHCVLS